MPVVRVLFSAAFALAGLYLLRVIGALWKRQRDYRKRGLLADGEIVGFEERSPSDYASRGHTYAPKVRFRTRDGAPVEFTSDRALRPNPYTVGQTLRVRYLPEDPLGADVDEVRSGWMMLIILTFMSLVALTIAVLPFVLPPAATR